MSGVGTSVRRDAGFTLIEILVVVAIVALLSTIVVSNVVGHVRQGRIEAARANILGWENAVTSFYLDNGFYPSTEQGLEAVISPSPVGRQPRRFPKGGYLTRPVYSDPWGHPFRYLCPGVHGEFDIFTQGADGAPGGSGEDRDLGTWNLQLPED